jgi:hypothetical protein
MRGGQVDEGVREGKENRRGNEKEDEEVMAWQKGVLKRRQRS